MVMFDEIIEKILNTIDEKSVLTETYPKFSGEGYRAHKIDIKNFYNIEKTISTKKIAFIDGGNAEIIGSANFSLNLFNWGVVSLLLLRILDSENIITDIDVESVS